MCCLSARLLTSRLFPSRLTTYLHTHLLSALAASEQDIKQNFKIDSCQSKPMQSSSRGDSFITMVNGEKRSPPDKGTLTHY